MISKDYRDPKLRREYRPLTQKEMSDFSESIPELKANEVVLIKRDLQDKILGYQEFSIAGNNRGLRRMERIFKGLVSINKKNNTVLNPVVIANAMASNNSILFIAGLKPTDVYKYQEEATVLLKEFGDIEHKMIEANLIGDKKTHNELSKKLVAHPMHEMVNLGFMQSIVTEVLNPDETRDNDATRMFNDVLKWIDKEATDENGMVSKTGLETLVKLGRGSGLGVSIGMEGISKVFDRLNYKNGSVAFDTVSKDLKQAMLESKDLKGTVDQLVGANDSVVIREMSDLMRSLDQTARYSIYKYYRDQGLSKSEAKNKSLDYFVDYRQRMTSEMSVLSEYGISPYISFIARIQKPIVNLLMTNPIKAFAVYAALGGVEEATSLHTGAWNIAEANIFSGQTFRDNPSSGLLDLPAYLRFIASGDFEKLVGIK